MDINDILEEVREWIKEEKRAGRAVDMDRIKDYARLLVKRRNQTPQVESNDLTPEELDNMIYHPFSDNCIVRINHLTKETYEKIPLVRQALFLMKTLNEKELKLTKLGWLPLKIVAETYRLGQPIYIIETFNQKRINEYEAGTVELARNIIDLLGWTKVRKGVLSLTVKGRKAFADIDYAANEILRFAISQATMDHFDGVEDHRIGNHGRAYSIWLLHKYGSVWRTSSFYQSHYRIIFDYPDEYNIYATRVLSRLFYWLGIVETSNEEGLNVFSDVEYRESELFSKVFSFSKVAY